MSYGGNPRIFADIREVYVAVSKYYNYNTKLHAYRYFGPYDTPGKAKALRTIHTKTKPDWLKDYDLIEEYVIRPKEWERVG